MTSRTEQNIFAFSSLIMMSVDRRHNRIDRQHLEFSIKPNEEKMTDLMDKYIYTDEDNPILGTWY